MCVTEANVMAIEWHFYRAKGDGLWENANDELLRTSSVEWDDVHERNRWAVELLPTAGPNHRKSLFFKPRRLSGLILLVQIII